MRQKWSSVLCCDEEVHLVDGRESLRFEKKGEWNRGRQRKRGGREVRESRGRERGIRMVEKRFTGVGMMSPSEER